MLHSIVHLASIYYFISILRGIMRYSIGAKEHNKGCFCCKDQSLFPSFRPKWTQKSFPLKTLYRKWLSFEQYWTTFFQNEKYVKGAGFPLSREWRWIVYFSFFTSLPAGRQVTSHFNLPLHPPTQSLIMTLNHEKACTETTRNSWCTPTAFNEKTGCGIDTGFPSACFSNTFCDHVRQRIPAFCKRR